MNANFEAKIFVKLEKNKYNILRTITDLDHTIRNYFALKIGRKPVKCVRSLKVNIEVGSDATALSRLFFFKWLGIISNIASIVEHLYKIQC